MWELTKQVLFWLSVPILIILVLQFLFYLIAVFTPHKDIRNSAEKDAKSLDNLGAKYLDLIGNIIAKIFPWFMIILILFIFYVLKN
jgi:hypothetical protein